MTTSRETGAGPRFIRGIRVSAILCIAALSSCGRIGFDLLPAGIQGGELWRWGLGPRLRRQR